MWLNFLHHGDLTQLGGRSSAATDVRPGPTAEPDFDVQTALWSGRASCCEAKPAVLVIMPPEIGQHQPTELLLCWQHYQASQHSLAVARTTAALARGRAASEPVWLTAVSA